jgi:hypothetical protein
MPLARQLIVVLALASAACVHVAPYERGRLARPDMATTDIVGPAEQHARVVHEGANGGGTLAESGCGCN